MLQCPNWCVQTWHEIIPFHRTICMLSRFGACPAPFHKIRGYLCLITWTPSPYLGNKIYLCFGYWLPLAITINTPFPGFLGEIFLKLRPSNNTPFLEKMGTRIRLPYAVGVGAGVLALPNNYVTAVWLYIIGSIALQCRCCLMLFMVTFSRIYMSRRSHAKGDFRGGGGGGSAM